jgi:hypothetical protein
VVVEYFDFQPFSSCAGRGAAIGLGGVVGEAQAGAAGEHRQHQGVDRQHQGDYGDEHMNGLTCAFTGRLGSDPEQRYLTTGKVLLTFSIAVDESYTATEDEAAPETTWVRVTA